MEPTKDFALISLSPHSADPVSKMKNETQKRIYIWHGRGASHLQDINTWLTEKLLIQTRQDWCFLLYVLYDRSLWPKGKETRNTPGPESKKGDAWEIRANRRSRFQNNKLMLSLLLTSDLLSPPGAKALPQRKWVQTCPAPHSLFVRPRLNAKRRFRHQLFCPHETSRFIPSTVSKYNTYNGKRPHLLLYFIEAGNAKDERRTEEQL